MMPAHLTETDLLCAELARSKVLVLLLDLDGTLIPFAATVEAAILDHAGAELLRSLQDAGVSIVVATGRPRALVEPLRSSVDGIVWSPIGRRMCQRVQGDVDGASKVQG